MRNPFVTLFVFVLFIGLAALDARSQTVNETQRFYAVRGAKLYTQTYGHGAPLLFLHGGLSFFDNNFSKQVEYFSGFRTVIGIDQRGHGHTPDTAEPLSYQQMADDTAAVIEKMGLQGIDIVGLSDGADIGLMLARDHPKLVRSLVISGANLRSDLSPEEWEKRRRWTKQQTDEKVAALAQSLPPWFRTDYDKASPDGPDHWMVMVSKAYALWIQPTVIEPGDLKKIAAPVLVMAGDQDFTPIDETLEIFKGLPNSQLFILPGTGHGTFFQSPELANLAIRRFLEKASAGSPSK